VEAVRYTLRALKDGRREVLDESAALVAAFDGQVWRVDTVEYRISLRPLTGFVMEDVGTGEAVIRPTLRGAWRLATGQQLKARTWMFRPFARSKMQLRLVDADAEDVLRARWVRIEDEGRCFLRGEATVMSPDIITDLIPLVCCAFWKLETQSRGQRPSFLRPEDDGRR
jgi:hypothetical protein